MRSKTMGRRDDEISKHDELTIDNVDEQIERLTRLPVQHPFAQTPLARTIRNIQRLYKEEQQLEESWVRISAYLANTPEDASTTHYKDGYKNSQIRQGEKIMSERK